MEFHWTAHTHSSTRFYHLHTFQGLLGGKRKKKITKNYPTAVLLTGLLIVISGFCFYFVAGQNPSLRKDMEAFKGLGYTVQLD